MYALRKIGSALGKHRIGFASDSVPWVAVRQVSKRIAEYRKLQIGLADLRRRWADCKSLDEQVALVRSSDIFRTDQKQSEIVALVGILKKEPPRYVCEIGTSLGGTLFLLSQVCRADALVLSVDLGVSFERCLIHSSFATRHQRLVSIRGNSRDPETIRRVRSLLQGKPLDLLFIDGDHSYEGVKADFTNYSPLVRDGGLVAFHDIVADFGTRFGTPTGNETGGVPKFWCELKTQQRFTEIIDNAEQDGYGIGITYV